MKLLSNKKRYRINTNRKKPYISLRLSKSPPCFEKREPWAKLENARQINAPKTDDALCGNVFDGRGVDYWGGGGILGEHIVLPPPQ